MPDHQVNDSENATSEDLGSSLGIVTLPERPCKNHRGKPATHRITNSKTYLCAHCASQRTDVVKLDEDPSTLHCFWHPERGATYQSLTSTYLCDECACVGDPANPEFGTAIRSDVIPLSSH